ncbi:MAG: Serine/threonine-protein phosphatase 2B catalytic subunit A2, partial [Parcubacteria group bacterium GW2011_GWE2_40_8]
MGDIVDRGFYGAECFYTLLSLKLNNWNNVFILSGNHEIKEMWEGGGFRDELLVKFGEITPLINACFNVLPAALFIGSNNQWIQCCHGGVEPSFDTKQFLQGDSNFYDLSNLNRKRPAIQFMPDIPDIVKFEETLTRAINDISEVDVADADVFNLKQVLREFLRDRSEKKHANLEHAKNAILNDKLDEYPFFTAPEPGDVEPLKLALIAIKKRITSSILENFDNDFKFNPFSSGFNWCDFGDLHDGPFAMGYTLNRGYFCSGYTHENL